MDVPIILEHVFNYECLFRPFMHHYQPGNHVRVLAANPILARITLGDAGSKSAASHKHYDNLNRTPIWPKPGE